ncbi:MAG: DUF3500 domain-containing protein [Candidatus Poribacteria bacterium]|nr:DUF3500 domain-containing protein [Candidatus Poribacteria bacterium]
MTAHTHNTSSTPLVIPASETAERMATACANFLETLTPDLRRKAEFAFEDTERHRWHYIPREMFERNGVFLKEMNDKQRQAAFDLLASGLSQKGYQKATAIIDIETTLGEIERSAGEARLVRDPQLYAFSVFGDPTNQKPWGWRAEGHHVSLNFTVVNRELVTPNPSFFGSNPAEVRHGPKKGLRILSVEEDLARQLLSSLNTDQRSKTIINATAPADILTREQPKVELGAAEGLAAESMTSEQREVLVKLTQEYIDRLPDELAKIEERKLRDANINDIHFAWAGAAERNKPHYYRLHGPFFFVEYDNTQNDANHIHTVWRHIEDDFGLDLLRLHYQRGHHHA